MTFWNRVEEALAESEISEAELSRRIGFTQAGINGWKTRGAIPRADVAIRAADVLNVKVEWLVNGTGGKSAGEGGGFFIPVMEQELSAGPGALVPDDDVERGFLEIPKRLSKIYGKELGVFYVKGDSMEPTLHNGDLAVCSTSGWDSGEGIYAIRLNGMGYVKRIQVGGGKILIKSDNPKYDTIEEPIGSDNLQIVGKIVFFGIVQR